MRTMLGAALLMGILLAEARGADFNADGRDDIAVFRPSQGRWAVRLVTSLYLGQRGDIPVPLDLSGDGTDRAAVFRPANGLWAVHRTTRVYYGEEGDIPLGAGGCSPAGATFDYVVKAGDGLDLAAALESDSFLSVFVPAGTYSVSRTINVDNVRRIAGEASWSTIIDFSHAGYYLSIDKSHCLVEGVCVRGGGLTTPAVRGNVYITADYVTVQNCASTGSEGSGFEWSASAGYPTFIDCFANESQDAQGGGFQGPSLEAKSSRLVACAARYCAGNAFSFCDNLSSCYVDGYNTTSNGFLYCDNLSACVAANCSLNGFRYCDHLSACEMIGNGNTDTGFSNCHYLSACEATDFSVATYSNCTYLCSESCH